MPMNPTAKDHPMTATVANASLRRHLDVDLDGATTVAGLPGHFCLHYQPQIDLDSGATSRAEALLRWLHPGFGLLRPHVSLEGTRWAVELGGLEDWAAREVCRQGGRWARDGLWVQVALNVSATFLFSPGFVNALRYELVRSDLSPHLLAIDIPLAAVASDPDRVVQISRALAEVGIGVVIDGVIGGTRSAGLRDVDADTWKIDLGRASRSDASVHPSTAGAVDQAHEAGALAIAKAVEDDRRLAEVRALGFDGAFGNIVSPPLPADSARDVLHRTRPDASIRRRSPMRRHMRPPRGH